MGSLGGHLIPGSFFIIFSIWWSFVTSIRYFQSNQRSGANKNVLLINYKATVTMPCICLPCLKLRRLPVESYIKLILVVIGILIEFVFGFEYSTKVNNSSSNMLNQIEHHNHQSRDLHTMNEMKVLKFTKNSLQHICMYFSFLLGALIEIMLSSRAGLPKKSDFIFGAMGFFIEAILFAFHLHGRSLIDIHVHTLLVISIILCLIFTCLEIFNDKEILFTYGRIASTLLQGIWFCQVGFILYTPDYLKKLLNKYNFDINDEHDLIMTVTALFCFDIFSVMIYLISIGWCVKKIYVDFKFFEKQWSDLSTIDELSMMGYENLVGSQIHLNSFMPLSHNDDGDDDDDI